MYVRLPGQMSMPLWSASNWDTQNMVCVSLSICIFMTLSIHYFPHESGAINVSADIFNEGSGAKSGVYGQLHWK